MAEKTTKAAKCPKCGNYHLIASIDLFESDKRTRKDFMFFMKQGFDIINVTTEEAKQKFGHC